MNEDDIDFVKNLIANSLPTTPSLSNEELVNALLPALLNRLVIRLRNTSGNMNAEICAHIEDPHSTIRSQVTRNIL